ncbi:cysteine desulfurase family protein [Clostridium pasteurianum]|uniref:Cysteine desulfurase family protein n=1 Tax=Clostridium pasteurianum BC1 TaxID=86416 RepID=R4JYA7_CLOPA|nr:cysteine desulfurase family protein [Clostridium pasteurianum]AGK95273.1 cysteine desulfurase family protein [Clostridium pasteurianum BC1]
MEVYMDNSATTRPYKEVIDEMVYVMEDYYGNPSSAYSIGVKAEKKCNEARNIIAKSINASKEEIIFTSGGSESNNFLLKGFVKGEGHIITTKIEHPSVMNTCMQLESEGIRVTYLDVDARGKVDVQALESSINKDTQIVSIMHVNNEIGVIQDLETIGKIIKEKSSRIKFHVDAVQSYGKLNIDVHKCNIDLLSASGHKIHGPRGIGFAYVRKGLVPKVLIEGGGQEKNYRSGTENLPAICGMAKASEKIYENIKNNYKSVEAVKKYFIDKLKNIKDIRINSEIADDYLPHILNVSFKGVRAEVLLHYLEEYKIYVSNGSACSAKRHKMSHVLKSIGLSNNEIEGAIRFSFNEYNSFDEVDYTIEKLNSGLQMLRRLKI